MIYRKRGDVVRWENGTLIRVSESGVAIEEGELFTCAPESESSSRPVVESSRVMETVREIEAAVRPLKIERLIVSEGIAEHEYEGKAWREETFRVHCSIINQRIRALVDSSTRRLDDLHRIANALSRAEQHEREPPARLVLAPNVTAALLPSLVGLAPPNVELFQAAGGIDGKGNEIIETHREPWPNWYRPSYRVRPIRVPLNLRLRCDVTGIERDRPVAVALLAPPDGLTLRVLIVDGMEDAALVYPATVRVTRIDAVGEETVWYPYGGGSFGAEMML